MYKEKYLKYKTKYLDLKSQLGGAPKSKMVSIVDGFGNMIAPKKKAYS